MSEAKEQAPSNKSVKVRMGEATATDKTRKPNRGWANLKPPASSEEARLLGIKSGEARRAKRAKAEALAMADLVPAALKAYKKALDAYLAGDEGAQAALRAAEAVLDRTEGKPTQRIDQVTEHRGVTPDELAQVISPEQLEEFRKRRQRAS